MLSLGRIRIAFPKAILSRGVIQMGHKKGFTLVEIVIAIAIILIIGGVSAVALVSGIQKAEDQSIVVEEKSANYDHSKEEVDGLLEVPAP